MDNYGKTQSLGIGFCYFCHSERSEGSYRRAVGNGPYKAGTHVSPRRGGNLPPAVWISTDPAAIVGSFVTSLLRMTERGGAVRPLRRMVFTQRQRNSVREPFLSMPQQDRSAMT